jgi:hypothetical protein
MLLICCTATLVVAQQTSVTPASLLKAPAGNDRVMVSNGGVWGDQPISYLQSLNYWSAQGVDLYHASGNVGIGTSTPSQRLVVMGTIQAGAVGASSGTVLLRALYDDYPAQCLLTEYSSGGIGLSAFMYQQNSATWRSSFNYGAISRAAAILTAEGFRVITAPQQNVTPGQPLAVQPSTVFTVNQAGRTLVGTISDNGDRLQVTGSQSLTGALKLGTGTVGAISAGSTSITIWNKGTVQFALSYTASFSPAGVGNGDLWQEVSTRRHGVVMRSNDVNRDLAFTTDFESVKGKVSAAGALVQGKGVASVSKISTGIYLVNLTATLPNADYQILMSSTDGVNAHYGAQNTNSFQVTTRSGGTLVDAQFMFQVLPW